MTEALRRPLPPSVFARLAEATRYVIAGVSPETWFGPLQPLAPMAPPEVKGRQFDYPFGANLNYIPRADNLHLVCGTARARRRAAAAARGDRDPQGPDRRPELCGEGAGARRHAGRLESHRRGFRLSRAPRPAPLVRRLAQDADRGHAGHRRRHHLSALYRGGSLYSLDIIDGATIKPLIGEDGRAPEAPDPAYQQILHGVPAADFSDEELLYLPRNLRAHRLYGLSPDALGRTRRRRDRQATSAGNHNFCPSLDFATDLAVARGFCLRIARART